MTSTRDRPAGTLHIVGTPIGNLKDLSLRAREVLGAVDLIAAEDTRRTRGLLSSIGLKATLIAYHDHNEAERAPHLLDRLLDGESVALVSDAGTPLISDPGWRLVRTALARGIAVVSVPGPSAVSAALSVCGLPTDRFVFEGFLPRRKRQRAERLGALLSEGRTMVFFESVHRLTDTLRMLSEQFGGQREAAIARELTKAHECVYTGSLAELNSRLGVEIPLLGEFVVVVAGAHVIHSPEEAEALRVFSLLCAVLPPDKAVSLSARITGLPRNAVYRLTRKKD
ncbi:16S rRNA (cytidine(1402)-2'-O)-methyltransferase [Candidatus Rariloculus sp.]|uniref:16S rRNA (cytidine(1402)-2'-O)-methyltransferase n=1 Tax=Candidatus Rariloculus sp. TaxID=3101265 RepID=UPI003D0D8BCF